MIDDPAKTAALLAKLEAALPIAAQATPRLLQAMRQQVPDLLVPDHGYVTKVTNSGDAGGILCGYLPEGADGTGRVLVVSMTQLDFGFQHPLSKEIRDYQEHRIRTLKQQAQ